MNWGTRFRDWMGEPAQGLKCAKCGALLSGGCLAPKEYRGKVFCLEYPTGCLQQYDEEQPIREFWRIRNEIVAEARATAEHSRQVSNRIRRERDEAERRLAPSLRRLGHWLDRK